jgi:hypothetical protein
MTKRKEGHEVIFLEVLPGLKERLRAVAERNHRSMVAEAVVALERHVRAEEAAFPEEATAQKGKGKKGGAR